MSDTNVLDARERALSRRRFCAGACQVAGGATIATLITACGGGTSPTSPSGGSSSRLPVLNGQFASSRVRVAADGPLGQVGGAALVESIAGVFLVSRASESSFTAVEGICTHEGCTITNQDGGTFVCPCHGSRYTFNGQVTAGPARASLRQYSTTFADGVVTIAV
jgi:Rieske Fe-S protein